LNKINFAKALAVFALILLVFSTIQPALIAFAKEGEKKDEDKAKGADKKAEEQKNEEKKGSDSKKQGNSTITADQAKENATRFLIRTYGNATYKLSEIKFSDGNYRLEISNSTVIFKLIVSGKDGRIISSVIQKTDQRREDSKKEDKEKKSSSTITAEQAKFNATRYLIQRYGNAIYKILEIEFDDGDYELKIGNGTATFKMVVSGKDGRILSVEVKKETREGKREEKKEVKEERKEAKEGRKAASAPKINASRAVAIALEFLKKEFGLGNYTLIEVRLNDGKYEIKFTKGGEEFELEIDATTGIILEFEQKNRPSKREDQVKVHDERKGKKEDRKKEERVQPSLKVNASQAISIALEFLRREAGPGNYTVVSVELDDARFEVKVTKNDEEFELKIDGVTGKIIEFEQEKKELKFKVEKEDERHLKIDVKKENKKENIRQKLNVQVQKNDASIKLEFQGKENVTKSELEFRVLFDRLIEFRDNGTKPGLFDSNDTIISSLDLRRLQWNVNKMEDKDVNGTISMITITQNASSSSVKSIAFIYHLAPTTKTIKFGNSTIAQVRIWQIKFDVHIEKFKWARNDTMLALAATFNSEFEAHIPGEATVKFKGADSITPFFNWGGNATADGANIVVGATLGNKSVVLTYPHFNNALIHDPLIGYIVSEAILQILVPALMAAGAIIIGTVLLGVSALRSKRLALNLRKYAQ
jgi:uncharacterized membrane protein YkoI